MNHIDPIEVDEHIVQPIAIRFYQELIHLELSNEVVDSVFPVKPVPRYLFRQNDLALGHFKVLSVRKMSNNATTVFTLHRQ